MTDRIEPGCLCVVVNPDSGVSPRPHDVCVARAQVGAAVVRSMIESCRDPLWLLVFRVFEARFGLDCWWEIESDIESGRALFPEPALRRLPPPSTEFLTREKDLEVTA